MAYRPGYDDPYNPDQQQDPTQPPAPTGAPKKTGPVTAGDPRLTDPAYASDPDVLAYLNSIYGSTGTALNKPDPSSTWDPVKEQWNTAPPTTAPPSTGSGGTVGNILAPFNETFTAPTPRPYETAPTFTAPTFTKAPAFVPDTFTAPTYADAVNDPGYQFAADQGQQQLQQSAASRGLLNTGGTLKDILAWGQNYAAQRYGDVYNRNYNTFSANEGAKERAYATNYGSQYLDPYKFAYQGALDTFNPSFSAWQTNLAATQRANENDYANAYNLFNFDYNKFRDQRDSTFDKTFKYATA